jgi:hypothetical protein
MMRRTNHSTSEGHPTDGAPATKLHLYQYMMSALHYSTSNAVVALITYFSFCCNFDLSKMFSFQLSILILISALLGKRKIQ